MDPVPSTQRLLVLDVLRGWAVFGMLVVNVGYFARQGLGGAEGADAVAAGVVQLLASGKFWTLFSVLFGLGFAMQLERAAARGAGFVALWTRRMAVLLVFGLVHALLHPQEILHRYALLGLLLLPLRRARDGTLIAIGLLALLAVPVGQIVAGATGPPLPPEATRIYAEGSLPELVAFNAGRFVREALDVRLLTYLPWFLLGVLVGRRRLLESVDTHLPRLRRARWWLLGLGLGLQALGIAIAALPPAARPFARSLLDLGSGSLGLFYAVLLVLAVRRVGRAWWTERLAAVGRLALTNYVLQTVIVTTLLYGYGGGWYGEVGYVAGLGLALVVYALQVAGSRWWTGRFERGPLEALWRRFTYGTGPALGVAGAAR